MAQELMQRMDKYQVRYQKYPVNIRESSQMSLQLYLALRNFYTMVRSNISERYVVVTRRISIEDPHPLYSFPVHSSGVSLDRPFLNFLTLLQNRPTCTFGSPIRLQLRVFLSVSLNTVEPV